ncbi:MULTISPECIES: acetoacetate--CoA ligase [unclassified Polaromonas]|uniref:acetoacetate--CoA ligase n=1 Tax=unclassified Polaromonas TaxID=2638319 RepID=UPI0018CB8D8E|nr:MULTISPECIES: acetoacetate--CoA ligase [unclassified Polaromonas]MBG6071485.1 acetoacetyl-CoA synthetase [Polaromonas sp. CG_9.7]MBG6113486.1 acetoacetyl-CoA synthetase [Polaromonas sp. CG_9.2]MDH6183056.1 acetoacetyl-CoA synthetase [Polaromonas sp. CG_23.6]
MNETPTAPPQIPQIRLYQDWLRDRHGLVFESYDALWRWSTTELDAFWQSIWDYFDLQSPTPHSAALDKNAMPGACWFPGAQVNYARQVLRHVDAAHAAGLPAVISSNEKSQRRELSWPELRRQVASLALHLQAQGVQPGDRVAAYLPNIPETLVAFLATVSIGGVWSVCAPDMGTHAVLDRFRQIAPTVLIACDGVTHGGRDHDRLGVLAELRQALPSVRHTLLLGNLDAMVSVAGCAGWTSATARNDDETDAFEPLWLGFDHPLWIVYSSGTTGLPKPIVHGHGGMVLVQMQLGTLHNDVGCSYQSNSFGERYHWYSSTGWVMWNAQLAGLLGGTTCVIFDGNPGGAKDRPYWTTLWRFAADTGVTFFGAGAAFYASCMKAGITPPACGDLRRIRALGSTGSPLSAEVQQWGSSFMAVAGVDDIWWCNISGGTDFAGAFIGGNRELPQTPGKMQCRMLGACVEAWNDNGQPVIGEVGELVCTQPIPSMPLYLWGDDSGARLLASYFDMYPPGHGRQPGGGDAGPEMGAVWRHGDWLKIDPGVEGGCVIYGRSDATINRHGLRMGTSELYSAIEALPEVLDSLVVDLEYLGRPSYMPLFVVLGGGAVLDDAMRARLNHAVRTALSPRFVPDDIFQVAEVPRTLSGKKQELPIKKLLLGQPLEKVLNRDAMANPHCLDWYVGFAQQRLAQPG